ncbi:phasin family protein [Paraburkholderia sp. UCT31]|uniref:phasin family protein n=1 Tax=Paraburkholderia sp. UCT31 TaxID=2615209 RepID=UPI0016561A6C|nr:phasin family protein [Paraburkholderia sp. UCT31]MBC8737401.1 phasin family protein [Paraburkholderia sp. UCT31]
MSTLVPEQFAAAQKAGTSALYKLFESSFKGFEKLVELNIKATKASLAENQAVATEAVTVRSPEAFFTLQSRNAQASTEKAQAYWHHVNEIVAETRGEIVEASEKQVGEYVRQSQELLDNLFKNAPAGSEAFVSLWKTGFGAARDAGNAHYENAKAAAKQAVEVIDKAGKTVTAKA